LLDQQSSSTTSRKSAGYTRLSWLSLFEKVLTHKLTLETNAGHYDAGFDRGAKLLDALNRFWPPTQDAFRGIETFRQ